MNTTVKTIFHLEKYDLSIKTNFSPSAGYYMSVSKDQFENKQIPPEFLNITEKRSTLTFISLRLVI